jgi:DNA-binding MarR family transcriptional regulator
MKRDKPPDVVEVSALDLAEIKTLVLLTDAGREALQRILDQKGVQSLEDLDGLTLKNLLQYLRSL